MDEPFDIHSFKAVNINIMLADINMGRRFREGAPVLLTNTSKSPNPSFKKIACDRSETFRNLV